MLGVGEPWPCRKGARWPDQRPIGWVAVKDLRLNESAGIDPVLPAFPAPPGSEESRQIVLSRYAKWGKHNMHPPSRCQYGIAGSCSRPRGVSAHNPVKS